MSIINTAYSDNNKQPIGDYATNSALTNGLATKQNTLTAGEGISIDNNVISSTASGGAKMKYGLTYSDYQNATNGTIMIFYVSGSNAGNYTGTFTVCKMSGLWYGISLTGYISSERRYIHTIGASTEDNHDIIINQNGKTNSLVAGYTKYTGGYISDLFITLTLDFANSIMIQP